MSRSLYGLHKLTSAPFIRLKPNLCPVCEHFQTHKDWYGVCGMRQKLLSNPHTERGRCTDFEQADQPKLVQSKIDEWMIEGKEHREWSAKIDRRSLADKIVDALKADIKSD